ncbi:hypothetical protein ACVIW2_001465 [Bradyrhizobium huanghuaihaiense]
MTTIANAEAKIRRELRQRSRRGQSSYVENVDLVLCEDFTTVMIYCDTADELDAACACFDLPDGMPFDAGRLRERITLTAERLH